MKYFHSPLGSHYFQDAADVYSYKTEANGHVEAPKKLLYASIPCYAYKMQSTFTRLIMGDLAVDRWKIIFPLTFEGSDVEIKVNYKVRISKNGVTRQLRIEEVSTHSSTHIETEAVRDG